MSPRKLTLVFLLFRQARRDIIALDMSLICGFYNPELVNVCQCFHGFEFLEKSKEDFRGFIFVNLVS